MKLRPARDTVGRETLWKIVSTVSAMVGALIARKLLEVGWNAVRKDGTSKPILDPADRRFSRKDAVLWAVTAGIGLGIARIVSARLAVIGWEAATGTLPPGVEEPVEV